MNEEKSNYALPIAMHRRSKADRLLMARALVESIRQELNTAYRMCGECSLKHYENIEERKLANRLEGVSKSLGNVIRALHEREKEGDRGSRSESGT